MKILLVPNPVLRQKALKIDNIEKEDINIANKMMDLMIRAPGLGLAANQVGILKQIVTINFQDKEEGVEKDIDELRGLLNKLTSKNYDDMQKNILTSLTNIINKNCKEADLEKIGEAIFEIGSINKFWSALYAKLYKSILNAFPLMNTIYQKNFNYSLYEQISEQINPKWSKNP